MRKIFDSSYFFPAVCLLLILAYFFEYIFSGIIPNIITLLILELIYNFTVLFICINYVSKSKYFKENVWIKPKAGMYTLIVLIGIFTIKTIYDLFSKLL